MLAEGCDECPVVTYNDHVGVKVQTMILCNITLVINSLIHNLKIFPYNR